MANSRRSKINIQGPSPSITTYSATYREVSHEVQSLIETSRFLFDDLGKGRDTKEVASLVYGVVEMLQNVDLQFIVLQGTRNGI